MARTGIQGRGRKFLQAMRDIKDRQRRGDFAPDYDHEETDLEFWAQFLTPAEAARALGVSRRVIDQQLNSAIEGH